MRVRIQGISVDADGRCLSTFHVGDTRSGLARLALASAKIAFDVQLCTLTFHDFEYGFAALLIFLSLNPDSALDVGEFESLIFWWSHDVSGF